MVLSQQHKEAIQRLAKSNDFALLMDIFDRFIEDQKDITRTKRDSPNYIAECMGRAIAVEDVRGLKNLFEQLAKETKGKAEDFE